jgi:hypothetical protein
MHSSIFLIVLFILGWHEGPWLISHKVIISRRSRRLHIIHHRLVLIILRTVERLRKRVRVSRWHWSHSRITIGGDWWWQTHRIVRHTKWRRHVKWWRHVHAHMLLHVAHCSLNYNFFT